jgi:hypothetical protein
MAVAILAHAVLGEQRRVRKALFAEFVELSVRDYRAGGDFFDSALEGLLAKVPEGPLGLTDDGRQEGKEASVPTRIRRGLGGNGVLPMIYPIFGQYDGGTAGPP